jgi:Fe-S-cluster-containing hydrogenase component 2
MNHVVKRDRICPTNCPRPREKVCPTNAIQFGNDYNGVISDLCYGCGRCLPLLGNLESTYISKLNQAMIWAFNLD